MTTEIGSLAVSLSLDASNFNGSMTQVDRNLRVMGSELKAVKALGDDYGKSIEGLTTKKDILSRSVEAANVKLTNARKKYDDLVESGKASEAQLERQAKKVNDAQAQYNRLATELNGVEKALKTQSSSWTQISQKLDPIGGKMTSIGQGMTKMGQDLSMKVTAPLVAMGVAASKTAIDFESQMDRVGAIAGATASDMEKLSAKALELGANTSKSASEVAVGMENMAAMGFNVNEIMSAMPGIISAAEASGADMAQTADVVASALNAFGLEASDASRVADVLAQTANQSAADITDLQYAFKYAAPVAKMLGVSMEELAAATGIMADSGIKGEQAGTTLRSALLRLSDPPKEAASALADLGVKITDSQGKMLPLSDIIGQLNDKTEKMSNTQKAAALSSIFGTEAVSGMLAVIEAGPEKLDALTTGLENSAGASAETAAKMKDNLKGALEELGGTVETAAITIGDTLAPTIREASDTVKDLVEKFQNLSPEAQKTILAIGGIVAAAGPLLVVGGTIMSGVGGTITAISALSGAIAGAGGLSVVLGGLAATGGPILLTVAGLAALGVGAYKLSEEMKKPSIEVEIFGDKVSEATQKAVGGFLDLNDEATVALNQLSWSGQTVTGEMANNIIATFDKMGDQVLTAMQEDQAAQLETMQTFFSQSAALTDTEEKSIIEKMQTHQQEQQQTVTDGQARITEILNTAKEEKRAITDAERQEINTIQEQMVTQAVEHMTANEREQKVILERLKQEASEITAQQAAEVVANSLKQKEDVVKEANDQYNKTIAEIIKQRDEAGTITAEQADKLIAEATRQHDETVKKAEEMHQNVVTEAKDQAGEHADQVNWETGEVLSKWDVFKTDFSTKLGEIKKSASNKWDEISQNTSEKWDQIKAWPGKKIDEMKTSVAAKMEEVREKIETVWGKAEKFFEGVDLKQIGKDIIQGLIDGIGSMAKDVWDKAVGIANSIGKAIKDTLDMHSPSKVTMQLGKWTGEGFSIGLESTVSRIESVSNKLATASIPRSNNYAVEKEKVTTKNSTINQYITINSPEPTSPSENARKIKQASRQLAQEW